MGLLERIAASREVRYSADTYYSEYIQPFQYGGNVYGVPGANGLVQTLAGNRASEIVRTLPGYAAALRNCPPAFAAQLFRGLVLSQARFTFRNLPYAAANPRRMFGQSALGILERPWTNATTGELIARMEWHAGVAGNAFVTRQPNRLRVLRPDWVAIVYGSQQEPEDAAHALDGELLGYVYCNGGIWGGNRPQTLLPSDVAHWSPIPDPENVGVGMSWITPAIREIQSDQLSTTHKIRFFENGATPNLVVKGIPAATKEQFDLLVSMMEDNHAGVANAYRTLYLTAGADATVVGANMRQLDFKSVQGASETRIASLSRVPAVLLGISEGLQGSSLNAGNFGSARRTFADTWLYPTLQDLAAALAPIVDVPKGAELWFDTKDIPLLREDGKDAAEIAALEAGTIRQLGDAGYTPESIVAAIRAHDWSLLRHSGLYSVQLQPAGSQPAPKAPPAPARQVDGLRHMPGKHNQDNHGGGGGLGRAMPASIVSTLVAGGTVSRRPSGGPRLTIGGRAVELAAGRELDRFRRVIDSARYGESDQAGSDGVYRLTRTVDRAGRPHSEILISVRPVPGRYVTESGRPVDSPDDGGDEEVYSAEFDLVLNEGDAAFDDEPSARVSLAELDGIHESMADAAAAERLDSGNGPLDVFVAEANRVGLRMPGDDGNPVEVSFNRRDYRLLDAALDHVIENGGTRTVETSDGPVEVTFRGPLGDAGTAYTDDNALIISPPSGGPWGVAVSGPAIGDFLRAFEVNGSTAGIV